MRLLPQSGVRQHALNPLIYFYFLFAPNTQVVLEEFGARPWERVFFYNSAYGNMLNSARRGGSFGGIMNWILYHKVLPHIHNVIIVEIMLNSARRNLGRGVVRRYHELDSLPQGKGGGERGGSGPSR